MNSDLISRSALKEIFLQDRCGDNFLPKHFVISTIDNAPTVEPTYQMPKDYIKNKLDYSRPQGEWIIIDDTEKFIAKCSVCGRIEDSRMVKYHPFCRCGADMRGDKMTNKEAIERLKWVEKRISDITYSPESFEALDLAIKALEFIEENVPKTFDDYLNGE